MRKGSKMTSEQRERLSAAHKGKPLSAEHRGSIAAALRGKPKSAEHIAAAAAAGRGVKHRSAPRGPRSAATRAKLSAALSGRTIGPCPPERRAKIAAARRGHLVTAEARAQIAAKLRGRTATAETRAKLSALHKGRVKSVTERAALGASKRRHLESCTNPRCRDAGHGNLHGHTTIERILREALLAAFPTVVGPKRFGPYSVDAYVPSHHLAFEADGVYWHGLPGRVEKDAARDAELWERFALPVVRLGEWELRAIGKALGWVR